MKDLVDELSDRLQRAWRERGYQAVSIGASPLIAMELELVTAERRGVPLDPPAGPRTFCQIPFHTDMALSGGQVLVRWSNQMVTLMELPCPVIE